MHVWTLLFLEKPQERFGDFEHGFVLRVFLNLCYVAYQIVAQIGPQTAVAQTDQETIPTRNICAFRRLGSGLKGWGSGFCARRVKTLYNV